MYKQLTQEEANKDILVKHFEQTHSTENLFKKGSKYSALKSEQIWNSAFLHQLGALITKVDCENTVTYQFSCESAATYQ